MGHKRDKRKRSIGMTHRHKFSPHREDPYIWRSGTPNFTEWEAVRVLNCEVSELVTGARRRYSPCRCVSVAVALVFSGEEFQLPTLCA